MKVKCTTDRWDFLTYGKEYDVLREENDWYFVHDDEGAECLLCDYECVVIDEVAQQPIVEPTIEFKVGDKVKIIKKVETEGSAEWVLEMDKTIGLSGIITGANKEFLGVALEIGIFWWYTKDSLELIEESKQDKIKEELTQCNEAFEDYSSYPPPVIVNSTLVDYISYQEFLDAFDEEVCPSITVRKHEAFIEVNDQSFMCYTKQREQEVMKALIVLYGKREGEN